MRFLATLLLVLGLVGSATADQPNIILIMADDIGIEGLGCYGGVSYRTPNLDRMAANGIRFTRAYSQPLCTPTRVQLMTGKYNHRNWTSFGILDPSEKTFGHSMSAAGYSTAIIGKWQLQSYDPPDLPGAEKRRGTGMHPKDAGFDEYSLFHALHTEDKGSRYANPTMLEGKANENGQLKTYDGKYGEDVWVGQILDFFDRNRGNPTFVYYPMALPHWPFQPTPGSEGWNPSLPQETDMGYSTDMIEYMDVAVGNLMQGLKERGLDQDTIVIFYSDNGTHLDVASKLSDGRTIDGGKATSRQTGIHVPLIAHCPTRFAPAVCEDIVDASDFFPTLLDLAGGEMPDETRRDGISFAPQLLGKQGVKRDAAFFWYDSRPGWDKERFRREVFAVSKTHKLFRTGRLMRLTDLPLEEIRVNPYQMTNEDKSARASLMTVIERAMQDIEEPPLVDAYGREQVDLLYLPSDRDETNKVNQKLLDAGKEFSYGDGSIAEQKLWIFNPLDIDDGELRPCVFFIHGGGWGGSPILFAAQCAYLQRRGYNTVSIHFRAPKNGATPRDTLRDARMAYRWIQEHGKEHHIDTSQIVISGGSAGGHLSLALCTIGQENDPVIRPMPKGMVLFNPAIDLVDGWGGGRKKCESANIDPRSFSPAHQVGTGLPKTLVLSGSNDSVIPPNLLTEFQSRMKAKGNDCNLVIYPNAGHGFFNYGRESNEYFQATMWEFEEFLQSVLD